MGKGALSHHHEHNPSAMSDRSPMASTQNLNAPGQVGHPGPNPDSSGNLTSMALNDMVGGPRLLGT